MCAVIVLSVLFLIGRFVYLFHDRLPGGLDIIGGPGCYMMARHSCTFETEVCCPAGCMAAGGLWVDGEERRCRTGSCAVLDCGESPATDDELPATGAGEQRLEAAEQNDSLHLAQPPQ